MRRRGSPELLRYAVAGLAGGLLGSFAMNQWARLVSADSTRREAEGAAPGGDRVGRGVQPPQAEGAADEDATVRSASIAYRAVTGEEPDAATRRWLGSGMHYAFGAGVGVLYGLIATRAPWIRRAHGTVYGTLVWAIADEGIMPALGLSRGPRQLSTGVLAYGVAGHLVFGATLESVTRMAEAPRPPAPRPG